jgi:hypothetical protein
MKSLIKMCILLAVPMAILISCGNETKNDPEKKQEVVKPDSIPGLDPALAAQSNRAKEPFTPCSNDSMKELGLFIAGMKPQGEAKILGKYFASADFKSFADNFDRKWNGFDSSRIKLLKDFREKEIAPNVGPTKKLFYPFSGPDILYGYTFFPEAEEYVMLGLEPVGTLPIYDEKSQSPDSMDPYYKMVNSSLLAILKYSFFRTKAMKTDLKNQELDGTLHLLFLFITRTGNTVCSAKPLYIDTTGTIQYVASFPKLEAKKCLNKGLEIVFNTPDNKTKKLYYFSLNIADGAVKSNKGMVAYLNNLGDVNTYLKGASYLMHETYFSVIRNAILDHSKHIVQDDSGIAFRYFTKSGGNWSYKLYGTYTHPIPMFSYAYQKDLDSLYKSQGSKPIGFGIGYNFKDKNSNFMIATKK